MESNITAIISQGGEQCSGSEPYSSVQADRQLNWPARIKMFARRSAAGLVDFMIASALSLCYLGLPLGASIAFGLWEPAVNPAPTVLSQLIEHLLHFALAIALLNQLYFYTALAESGSAQATLGKILLGIKTEDIEGKRQTFTGVLRRVNLKYVFLALVCVAATFIVQFASQYIPSLQMEGLRTLMCTLIVAASFALSLVTDREQNLYDMLSRRLVVKDATVSAQERLQGFTAELAAMMRTLNPLQLGKKCRALAGDGEGIVTILLVFWTYLSAAAGTVLVVFASLIGLAMCEVENGIVAQSHQQLDLAAKHFKEALKLAPGVAVVYQDYYAFNDNLDLAKQEAACIRLFAIRGNAQDFLARARLRAKEQQYKPAKRDYMMALSGHSGQLNAHETEVATTELSMLQLEEEGAAIPDPQAKPMHTGPFETPPE